MRPVVEFNGVYKVTRDGRVWSERSQRFLTPTPQTTGYLTVTLRKQKKRYCRMVHRLVALAYVPNPDDKPCAHHRNGLQQDNRASNLQWCTHKEHMADCHSDAYIKLSLEPTEKQLAAGRSVGLSRRKLSMEQAEQAREEYYGSQDCTIAQLARKFGISKGNMSRLLRRKSYC